MEPDDEKGKNLDNPEPITILSLCTGYAGIELRLSQALQNPMRVVSVEIEAFAPANLVAKAEEGKPTIEALYPDLETFPGKRFFGCFDFLVTPIGKGKQSAICCAHGMAGVGSRTHNGSSGLWGSRLCGPH